MSGSCMGDGPATSSRIYLRLAPRNIAILKFLLEAHDNLACLTTVSPHTAVVCLAFAPNQEGEVREFLESVAEEAPWIEVEVGRWKRMLGCWNAGIGRWGDGGSDK